MKIGDFPTTVVLLRIDELCKVGASHARRAVEIGGGRTLRALKGRLLKAVERTLSWNPASKTKVEIKYKDTSDSNEAQHSETPSPSGDFASDLVRIRQF